MQKNGVRNYKHAYKLQKKTGETKDQIERQRARREYDAAGQRVPNSGLKASAL